VGPVASMGPRSGLPGGPLSRRRVLGALAGAAAVGSTLAGCGFAAPLGLSGPVRLVFATYNWTGTGGALLAQGAAQFEQQVRGVRVTTVVADPDPSRLAAAILDGTGPDVYWGQHLAPFADAGAALPLDHYLAGGAPGAWPAQKLNMLRTSAGQCALPAYNGVMCYAVRLQDWDDLHLPRPDPAWTHTEFAAEAARLTRDGLAGHRYGTSLAWYSTWLGDASWVFPAFGGAQTGPDGASSTLSTPAAVGAGEWIYNLIWSLQACTRDQCWAGVDLGDDRTAMRIAGAWDMAREAQAYAGIGAWDYYPFPVFPKGRTTYTNSDFFAISPRCAHPEAAWELLRWVSSGATWQRWVMRVGLLPPGTNDLWEEWEARVGAVAPPLRSKSLQYFSHAARGDYAVPQARYRYADAGAEALAAGYVAKLWNREIPLVQSAFAAVDKAVNAYLDQAAAEAATASAAAIAIRQALRAKTAALPAPAAAGTGAPPQAAGAGALLDGAGGVYTLRGEGAGLGGAADACTLAATGSTARRAEFTCRLDRLADVDVPRLSAEAQAGLMARGDLSSDAPLIALGVTGAGVVALSVRPAAGLPPQTWTAVAPAAGSGPPSPLLRSGGAGGANALLRPVWLRLRRDGAVWTARISADGRGWRQVGPAVTVEMAGCWVGLFAASADTRPGFLPGQAISAGFGGLDFHPAAAALQIGPG